jgi:ferric-dicitrate binding protein FerR (iron transport regulator)
MDPRSTDTHYRLLAQKWLAGTITPEELSEFMDWYHRMDDGEPLVISPGAAVSEESHRQRILEKILAKADVPQTQAVVTARVSFLRRYRWVAAAILLLMAGTGYWYMASKPADPAQFMAQAMPVKDVAPGRSGAILRLADGRKIVLDSIPDGLVAMEGDVQIIKAQGEIKYIGKAGETLYNDVVTDRGRQWQLILPDGSRVWLNAASSIRYPLRFSGTERLVEMTGEAYFEVVHNDHQPFRVKTGGMLIEDRGTAFNVNAYSDESGINTTLTEGLVDIQSGDRKVTLHPGQQARVMHTGMNETQIKVVNDVNLEEVTAWKEGIFHFEDADIRTILRQFARWYDVSVTYEGTIPTDKYFMIMGRDRTLSAALKTLQAGGVQFDIEGKHLFVRNTGRP